MVRCVAGHNCWSLEGPEEPGDIRRSWLGRPALTSPDPVAGVPNGDTTSGNASRASPQARPRGKWCVRTSWRSSSPEPSWPWSSSWPASTSWRRSSWPRWSSWPGSPSWRSSSWPACLLGGGLLGRRGLLGRGGLLRRGLLGRRRLLGGGFLAGRSSWPGWPSSSRQPGRGGTADAAARFLAGGLAHVGGSQLRQLLGTGDDVLELRPAVNFGTDFFLDLMRSPVCGLRTQRASRTAFSNEPKPVIATFSPLRDLAGDRVEHRLERVGRRLAVPLVTRGERVDEL